MRHSCSAGLCVSTWTCVLACVIVAHASVAAPAAQPQESRSESQQRLQEVTVTATRLQDHRTLARAVSGFVASHSAPSTRINQIGRWHEPLCPLVTGLQTPSGDFITGRILEVARSVGAPTGSVGKKCAVTVEIVFTREPQALLDHIAKAYRPMLGFYPVSQEPQMTTFSRPIQAWYETGTRSMETDFNDIPMAGGGTYSPWAEGKYGNPEPILSGGQTDSDATAAGLQPSGIVGSRLSGRRVRSEFIHILIIVDGGQLARYPLSSVADYLAMLSLTRAERLDQCAPLPSITDLLASGCAAPVANTLTSADRAYLTALYSVDLERNLTFEHGEIREQMMRQIEAK